MTAVLSGSFRRRQTSKNVLLLVPHLVIPRPFQHGYVRRDHAPLQHGVEIHVVEPRVLLYHIWRDRPLRHVGCEEAFHHILCLSVELLREGNLALEYPRVYRVARFFRAAAKLSGVAKFELTVCTNVRYSEFVGGLQNMTSHVDVDLFQNQTKVFNIFHVAL